MHVPRTHAIGWLVPSRTYNEVNAALADEDDVDLVSSSKAIPMPPTVPPMIWLRASFSF